MEPDVEVLNRFLCGKYFGCAGDHYTANVVDRNGYWSHFNDSACSRTNVESVLFETPYLMMYERM